MIVITGKNGYISNGLKNFLSEKGYDVKTVSVRNTDDPNIFEGASVVVHAAGIVHIKAKPRIYHEVNFELSKKLAEYAKRSGTEHFIFISTMSVYGLTEGEITENTPVIPKNPYGRSKLMAEESIRQLADEKFKVTVIRPPMVYGKNCPGNYAKLSALVKKTPVFPLVNNKRSMIYAQNLYNCIKKIIDDRLTGVILPQNSEYVNTSTLCAEIARCGKKKLLLLSGLGKIAERLPFNVAKKIFGSLYYGKNSYFSNDIIDFENSIKYTES